MSSRDVKPQGEASDLDDGEERGQILGVACCDAAPLLDVQEGVLHQVSQAIEMLVVMALDLAIFARRNLCLHPQLLGLLDDGIAVIALVRDQMFSTQSLDQCASFCTIRPGSCCNSDSDRQTMRIHGQMYLGVEPPFVRPMPWLPPRAPAACPCTLQ